MPDDERESKLQRLRQRAYLSAEGQQELERIARGNPILEMALKALDELSADPEVCEMAERRAIALYGDEADLADDRSAGTESSDKSEEESNLDPLV